MAGRQAVGLDLKASLVSLDPLDAREREDHQVYLDLQDSQEFQVQVAVVSPVRQVSQESEVRREMRALQECPCRVPQGGQVPPVLRVHQGPPDLQAIPLEEATVLAESLGVPAHREREVSRERRVRKVRRATPV